jgi:hypothetical protein
MIAFVSNKLHAPSCRIRSDVIPSDSSQLIAFLFHHGFEIIASLHIQPESGSGSEKPGQPDRRIGGDPPPQPLEQDG